MPACEFHHSRCSAEGLRRHNCVEEIQHYATSLRARDLIMIKLQRVYEHRTAHGTHFLVERLWPRGVKKESLHLSEWLKDVAPSDSLRRWLQHDVAKWGEFQRRCRRELDEHPDAWAPIVTAARAGDVVLLYSSHDTEHNNAVVLRAYVNEKLTEP
jgi:uncharacterized protein YeaO (DUF488 family)